MNELKNLIDRLIPLLTPAFELRDGHCRHATRESVKGGLIVLVANCAFWEMDNFDPLLAHVQALARNTDRRFAGALLRPHGPALGSMLRRGMPVNDVLEAAREAVRQLVETGAISRQTLAAISRPLLSLESYMEKANRRFERALGALAAE